MDEKDPGIKVTYNGDQEFEGTPENVVLYTFLGRTALGGYNIENSDMNHVYLKLDDSGETMKGMYLFEKFHKDAFELIARHIKEYDYPQLLNMRHAPESDIRAYLKYKEADEEAQVATFTSDLPDFLPEDFK